MSQRKTLVQCEDCRGDCCSGMAIEIPKPRTRQDYDDIRWYLYHERTHVYIDREGDWVAEIDVPCRHRDPLGGRCKIYGKRRPPMCRNAKHEDCEMNLEDARVRFLTVEDYDAWLKQKRRRKRKR